MIQLRKSKDRGYFDHGWLQTYHTFSFADYHDPDFMGFRALRVINEDRVQPGQGFGTHPHRDMEIITYVASGELEHKDSMGNGSVIRAGEVQYMSAGTGVTHSEFNPSKAEPVHLLQIWIHPNQRGCEPRYDQKIFSTAEKLGKVRLVVSEIGEKGSIAIRQDTRIYASVLQPGREVSHELSPDRHAWIQIVEGGLLVNSQNLSDGDGAAVSGEKVLNFAALKAPTELLLFDLA